MHWSFPWDTEFLWQWTGRVATSICRFYSNHSPVFSIPSGYPGCWGLTETLDFPKQRWEHWGQRQLVCCSWDPRFDAPWSAPPSGAPTRPGSHWKLAFSYLYEKSCQTKRGQELRAQLEQIDALDAVSLLFCSGLSCSCAPCTTTSTSVSTALGRWTQPLATQATATDASNCLNLAFHCLLLNDFRINYGFLKSNIIQELLLLLRLLLNEVWRIFYFSKLTFFVWNRSLKMKKTIPWENCYFCNFLVKSRLTLAFLTEKSFINDQKDKSQQKTTKTNLNHFYVDYVDFEFLKWLIVALKIWPYWPH